MVFYGKYFLVFVLFLFRNEVLKLNVKALLSGWYHNQTSVRFRYTAFEPWAISELRTRNRHESEKKSCFLIGCWIGSHTHSHSLLQYLAGQVPCSISLDMRQSSIRHPVEVEAIGLMQNGSKKTYMFSILWSDHNKVLIYRTFGEFKTFQMELKDRFPLEAGALKKSDRTLPKLKDAPRTIVKKKDTKRYLERLRQLETYSQTLLKLDVKISQCDCVVQFFTLHNQDLNPSFPEHSLFIMPSEKKEENRITTVYTPDISVPLVSHSYLCTAAYETVDLRNKPFKVKRHELLDVLLKESTGWWLVENEDRQLAWFPAPYLQSDRDVGTKKIQDEDTLCVAVRSYEAQNEDEISVTIGVVVEVLKKSDSGWWLISYNKRIGYVPSLYLKPYTNPCEKIQNILSTERYGSTPNLNDGKGDRNTSSYLHYRTSMDENRERSQSLGSASVDSTFVESELRSDQDSDLDSTTGSSSRINSDSENSSLNNSVPSKSSHTLLSGMPKVPPRPNPDEIIQRCSTVTKKKVQRSLAASGSLEVAVSRL